MTTEPTKYNTLYIERRNDLHGLEDVEYYVNGKRISPDSYRALHRIPNVIKDSEEYFTDEEIGQAIFTHVLRVPSHVVWEDKVETWEDSIEKLYQEALPIAQLFEEECERLIKEAREQDQNPT